MRIYFRIQKVWVLIFPPPNLKTQRNNKITTSAGARQWNQMGSSLGVTQMDLPPSQKGRVGGGAVLSTNGLGPGGFGILGVPLSNNPFHKGIPGIQTTNPKHLIIGWVLGDSLFFLLLLFCFEWLETVSSTFEKEICRKFKTWVLVCNIIGNIIVAVLLRVLFQISGMVCCFHVLSHNSPRVCQQGHCLLDESKGPYIDLLRSWWNLLFWISWKRRTSTLPRLCMIM